MTKKQPHSEDVLTDIRDYWYSSDFIALTAKRWQFNQVKTMLDVPKNEHYEKKAEQM